MKTLRIIGVSIKDAFKSVFRNFSLSIASISCITITLLIVSISMILSYRKYSTINNLVSDYMKISIKTLTEFKDKIYNIFNNNYHNSFI